MLVVGIPQYLQNLTNTNNTVLYTAPSGADFNASIVNSLLISNDSGSNDTITVTITDADTNVFSVFKNEEVGALSAKELLTKDLVLKSGEILKVQAATAARLHAIASVQELSKQRVSSSIL